MSMTRLFYRYKSHTRVKSFPFGPRDHCRSTFAPASGGLTGAEIHRLHIASTPRSAVTSNDGHRMRARSSRFAKLTGG